MVEENGQGVFVLKERGAEAVDSGRYDVGDYCPIHCAAPGKAMLAHFSESKINRIIERHGLPEVTKYTITDRNELMEELEMIREQGMAYSRQEGTLGTLTVAAPIKTPDGEVLGALSISGASYDEDRFEDTLADLVKEYANRIEIKAIN
jgi:DNA-binding IclR family transcriptional regulator